jgi:hypothetical protein
VFDTICGFLALPGGLKVAQPYCRIPIHYNGFNCSLRVTWYGSFRIDYGITGSRHSVIGHDQNSVTVRDVLSSVPLATKQDRINAK